MKLLAKAYDWVFSYPDRDLLLHVLRRSGGPLLDLGCGPARSIIMAMEAGFDAIGIDNDADMRSIGEQKILAGNFPAAGRIIEGSIVDVPFPSCGTIICMANTYSMILERNQRVAILKKAFKAIKPGGEIMIHVKGLVPKETVKAVTKTKADVADFRCDLSWIESQDSLERIFTMDWRLGSMHEQYRIPTRLLRPDDVQNELKEAGFSPTICFGNYDMSALQEDSPFQIHLAKALK